MHHVTLRLWNILCIVVVLGVHSQAAERLAWKCTGTPVEPCVRRHGRLSSQNGVSLTIWLIGTTRRVAVDDSEVPAALDAYLELTGDHSYIYGDFDVCPLEPEKPGHMRSVCVSGAERLVVQPLKRPRPSFRLLSTWPSDRRQEARE